jgi:hypothetical protein
MTPSTIPPRPLNAFLPLPNEIDPSILPGIAQRRVSAPETDIAFNQAAIDDRVACVEVGFDRDVAAHDRAGIDHSQVGLGLR